MIQRFQRRHEGPDILATPLEVEHHVGHPLARPVVGVLSGRGAAGVNREAAGLDEVAGVGAGTGGIKGRVLDEPDQFSRARLRNGGDTFLHEGDGALVVDEASLDAPFDRRRAGDGVHVRPDFGSFVNHFGNLMPRTLGVRQRGASPAAGR